MLVLAFHGTFFRRHLRPNYLVAYPGEDRLYRPRKLTINPAKEIGNATEELSYSCDHGEPPVNPARRIASVPGPIEGLAVFQIRTSFR
jgi:hypothetical protein